MGVAAWYHSRVALCSAHEYALSQIGTCPDMTLNVAITKENNNQTKQMALNTDGAFQSKL